MIAAVLAAAIVWSLLESVSLMIQHRSKQATQRLIDNEREALDWTIRMSYCRGALDSVRRRDIELGAEAYVIEWRETWGTDRREVSR
jgi:hypothetical protein